MKHLRDRPIRQKITFVIMLISSVVLLLACAALFAIQAYTLKQQSTHELAVIARITAHNSAAAVMFKDEDAAGETLAGLKTMPQIVSARLELTLVLTAIALELLQLHLGVCDLLLDSPERHSQPTLGVVVQVLHGLHALGASHAAPPMTAPSSTRLRL